MASESEHSITVRGNFYRPKANKHYHCVLTRPSVHYLQPNPLLRQPTNSEITILRLINYKTRPFSEWLALNDWYFKTVLVWINALRKYELRSNHAHSKVHLLVSCAIIYLHASFVLYRNSDTKNRCVWSVNVPSSWLLQSQIRLRNKITLGGKEHLALSPSQFTVPYVFNAEVCSSLSRLSDSMKL